MNRQSDCRRFWSRRPSPKSELSQNLGLTVLMAEQNFNQAIRIANRGYIIVHGEIVVAAESVDELKGNDIVKQLYLGGVV